MPSADRDLNYARCLSFGTRFTPSGVIFAQSGLHVVLSPNRSVTNRWSFSMDLTLLGQNQSVLLTLGTLFVVGIAAYLFGREHGHGRGHIPALGTDLDLNDTAWHIQPDDECEATTLYLRQSGNRVIGTSADGSVCIEGSTFGRRVCLVFADGEGRFPTVGSITAEIDPETEDFVGLRSMSRPNEDYLVAPVTLSRLT